MTSTITPPPGEVAGHPDRSPRRNRGLLIAVAAAAATLLLTACGTDEDSEATTATTGVADEVERTDFDVTVTDGGCTVVGPEEVTPGDYSFLLVDDSEAGGFELVVRKITGEQTYQDFLDAQPEPGAIFDRPDFIENVIENYQLAASLNDDIDDN